MSEEKPGLIRTSARWSFILGCVGVFAGPPLLYLYFVVADFFRGEPPNHGDPLVGMGEIVLVMIGVMVGVALGIVAAPVVAYILSRSKEQRTATALWVAFWVACIAIALWAGDSVFKLY